MEFSNSNSTYSNEFNITDQVTKKFIKYFKPNRQKCSPQYFLSSDNQTCIQCSENCDECVGPDASQCKKCSKFAFYVPSVRVQSAVLINCQRCDQLLGLYFTQSLTAVGVCSPFCGDGIVRFDRGEQCDDGNTINNDGCSQQCLVEKNFICFPQHSISQANHYNQSWLAYPSICSIHLGTKFSLNYTNRNDLLILFFNGDIQEIDLCQSFFMAIQSLGQGDFSFYSQNLSKNSCSIQLFFNVSLNANQLISVNFFKTIIDQNQGIQVQNLTTTLSKQYTYYSPDQQQQAQIAVKVQSVTDILILYLGVLVILVGGVDVYWNMLDIMTWVDTLYFINVDYPLNIKLFFQQSSWTGIFSIPNLVTLNQQTDEYYQPGPQKFNDQGITGCFLASVIGDIQFCIIVILVYIISLFVCSTLEKIYSVSVKSKYKALKLFQLDDTFNGVIQEDDEMNRGDLILLNLPKFLLPIYDQLNQIRNSLITIFLKFILLVFLDLQMASVLQLKAGEITRHPFITINIILALLFQLCGLYLPFYFYSVINKSKILLHNQSYEKKYGAIYEDILINENQGKFYCIFLFVKKTLFVYCLTFFYEQPILQSVTCSLVCCLNLILNCWKSQFKTKIKLIRQVVPEIGIFGSLATTVLFALDDQVYICLQYKNRMFSQNIKFQLGWLILFFIMSSVLVQCLFLFQMIGEVIKQRCQLLYNCLKKKN